MEIGVFSKYVKDLIIDHDKVEIPGLGIFYARFEGAHFSDNRATIYPPTRSVFFREEPVSAESGALLYEYASQEEHISADQAQTDVDWCISRLKTELRASKRCELPGLGEMRANSKNDFFFVADEGLDVFPDGLGLEPVCIKMNQPSVIPAPIPMPAREPISQPEQDPETIPELKPESEPTSIAPVSISRQPVKRRRNARKVVLVTVLSVLAVLFILLVLAYAYRHSLPSAFDGLTSWIDNLLNHILYNEEERQILGF